MVIRRTISRRKEKRLRSTEQPLSRKEPIVTSDHLDALPNVIDVENKHDLIDEKPTIFQELGGPHGLISALQMLSNAHLLTLVLCRQLHCGKYQDAYYLLTGILGCVGGFFLADTTDELQFRGVGKWAMRLQLLLIITACVDCIEIQCKECLMPYPQYERLMYIVIKQYANVFSLFSFVFHMLIPIFEATISS